MIYPAADLSEQISTAGKEASGTGNMKFSMNGALTIGTLDGANVEIREEVGAENFFLFGLNADEVGETQSRRLRPAQLLRWRTRRLAGSHRPSGRRGLLPGDRELFRPLVEHLLQRDEYLLLADYQAYIDCQDRVAAAFRDRSAGPDVDPQCGADGQILLGPLDPRILRRDLEDRAGDRLNVNEEPSAMTRPRSR